MIESDAGRDDGRIYQLVVLSSVMSTDGLPHLQTKAVRGLTAYSPPKSDWLAASDEALLVDRREVLSGCPL